MLLTIQHTSPIDALIAVTKRLSTYENQQQMDSEEFFDQYSRGTTIRRHSIRRLGQ